MPDFSFLDKELERHRKNKIKRHIEDYFLQNDDKTNVYLSSQIHGIAYLISTSFWVKKIKKVTITIFLGRPGILIGKQGSEINDFTNYLRNNIVENTEVILKEYQPLDLARRYNGF